ncbi:MAG: alpha/beta hydrolase, partial [Acidobacteriota bacterium]
MRLQNLPLLFAASALAVFASEPSVVSLWPHEAPGSEGKTGDEVTRVTPGGDHVVSGVHKPSVTVFLPAKETATGAAVVIAPGGGHSSLWMDHEGYNIAK